MAKITHKRKDMKKKIEMATKKFYDSKDKELIDKKAHEITIASKISFYIQEYFCDDSLSVDIEYNRDGIHTKEVNGKKIFPDIIVHKREPGGPNIAAIAVKGFWNNECRLKDESRLKALKQKYHYEHIFRIELKKNSGEVIEI